MAPAKTLTSLAEEKTLESRFVLKVAYNEFSNEIPVIFTCWVGTSRWTQRRDMQEDCEGL